MIPWHEEGATVRDLKIILEKEPNVCKKMFVVNRMIDPKQKSEVVGLLRDHGYEPVIIPFVVEDWLRCWTFKRKVLYATNINMARNLALRLASEHPFVIILDSRNMFVQQGWDVLEDTAMHNSKINYFLIGQWFMSDLNFGGKVCLKREVCGMIRSNPWMLMFGRRAREVFDERLGYLDKCNEELLGRIGVHGYWSKRRRILKKCSAGWVCRLPAGGGRDKEIGDKKIKEESVKHLIERVDKIWGKCYDTKCPILDDIQVGDLLIKSGGG